MRMDRSLDDEAMDNIDHALGRPVDPMAQGDRDHFAIETEADAVVDFRGSPLWAEGRTLHGMVYFHVTVEGRRALRRYLKDNNKAPKLFEVTAFGYTTIVAAKSRAAARYDRYLAADSCMPFIDYVRHMTVRAA